MGTFADESVSQCLNIRVRTTLVRFWSHTAQETPPAFTSPALATVAASGTND